MGSKAGWLDDSNIVHEQKSSWFFRMLDNWLTFQSEFLADYGWRCLGGLIMIVIVWNWLQPRLEAWRRDREDAAYHKDPDRMLAREEALIRAREAQERRLAAESARQEELKREKAEKKRQEAAELLKKYGYVSSGRRLGSDSEGFTPLSGGGSTSTYRAPKRSPCGGGGCGR